MSFRRKPKPKPAAEPASGAVGPGHPGGTPGAGAPPAPASTGAAGGSPPVPVAGPLTDVPSAEALAAHTQALEGVRRLHLDLAERLEVGEAVRGRLDQVDKTLGDVRRDQERLLEAEQHRRRGPLWFAAVLALGLVIGGYSWSRWGDALLGERGPVFEGSSPFAADGEPPRSEVEHDALLARVARAEESADKAREERNKQLGENARLRQQLIERQRSFDELRKTLDAAHANAEARTVAPVLVSRSSEREAEQVVEPLVVRINKALRASSIKTLQVVEAATVVDGAASGLLVMEHDRITGRSEVYPIMAASLSVRDSLVSLELVDEEGETAVHPMPRWDAESWRATGMNVPEDFLPVATIEDSLRALTAHHHYELVSLGGFQDGELIDLVLELRTPQGELLQTFSAGRAVVVAEGPELLLSEGSVTENGVERPFWNGQSRLPLPGSNVKAWLEAVGG